LRPVWRVSVTFSAYYAATGAAWRYLPIYYRQLGLTFETIGALAALAAAVQLLGAPAWGALADGFPRSRPTLPAAALTAAVGSAIFAGTHDLAIRLLGNVVLAGGLAGVASVLDARAMETLGAQLIRYGQIRALGSIAFIVMHGSWGSPSTGPACPSCSPSTFRRSS
jgi:MFS transporter, PPP family, 3-phenylpropionic acid transporter